MGHNTNIFQNIASVSDCLTKCVDIGPKCKSSEYHSIKKKCQTSSETSYSADVVRSPDWEYFEKETSGEDSYIKLNKMGIAGK